MYISACQKCRFGGEKDGRSHCVKESVYSHLTRCIQLKALEYYLERETVAELNKAAV